MEANSKGAMVVSGSIAFVKITEEIKVVQWNLVLPCEVSLHILFVQCICCLMWLLTQKNSAHLEPKCHLEKIIFHFKNYARFLVDFCSTVLFKVKRFKEYWAKGGEEDTSMVYSGTSVSVGGWF